MLFKTSSGPYSVMALQSKAGGFKKIPYPFFRFASFGKQVFGKNMYAFVCFCYHLLPDVCICYSNPPSFDVLFLNSMMRVKVAVIFVMRFKWRQAIKLC